MIYQLNSSMNILRITKILYGRQDLISMDSIGVKPLRIKPFFLILTVLQISIFLNCGTIFGIFQTYSYEKRMENRKSSMILGMPTDHSPIFAGLNFEYSMMKFLKAENIYFYLLILDFPLTILMDTVFLPISVPLSIHHYYKDKQQL